MGSDNRLLTELETSFAMPTLRRRTFLACAAAMATAHAADAPAPRPGCQANAWNLDPARFDLLLTALREMKELEFQGFETNIRFLQPQLNSGADAAHRVARNERTGVSGLRDQHPFPAAATGSRR